MKRATKRYLLGRIKSWQSRAHRSCDCLHKTGPINSWSWELIRSDPSLGNYWLVDGFGKEGGVTILIYVATSESTRVQ